MKLETIRANLTNNLKVELEERTIEDLLKKEVKDGEETSQYQTRNFNEEYTWSRNKATFFLESIFLGCELQSLVFYKNRQTMRKPVICDGYQRLETIRLFFNNELVLSASGLKKLPFLKNLRFKDLPDDYQKFLLKDCPIKTMVYMPTRKTELSAAEEEEIEKYIYRSYNTGIRLKNFEIQKAKFIEEPITQQLKKEIKADDSLCNQLEYLKIMNRKKKQVNIDEGMVKVRELLMSTYCSLYTYFSIQQANRRAEELYAPMIAKQTESEVIALFKKSINLVVELKQLAESKGAEALMNYQFIDSTYWLVSTILKDQLIDIAKFDQVKFIDYCIKNDTLESHFRTKLCHTKKVKEERFQFVAHFLEMYSACDMTKYFEPPKNPHKPFPTKLDIPTFEELKKYQYIINRVQMRVETLCDNLEEYYYLVHPCYQREEAENIIASSRIMESMLIGLRIPDILIYSYYQNQKMIHEVVDGQQRCLTFAGFLSRSYRDEFGNLQKSNKNHFKLTGLKIFKDYNGKTATKLDESVLDELKDYKINLCVIDADNNPTFDPVDHFVRLNMNINPLRNNSFMMWNVSNDAIVMKKIEEVTEKYQNTIFVSKNRNKKHEQNVTGLVYINYKNDERKTPAKNVMDNWRKSSVASVTSWLDKITDANRYKYLEAIDHIDQFLGKIAKWITQSELSLNKICDIKEKAEVSSVILNYLYFLLSDIPETTLLEKSKDVEQIMHNFYKTIHNPDKKDQVMELLEESKKKLKILYMYSLQETK